MEAIVGPAAWNTDGATKSCGEAPCASAVEGAGLQLKVAEAVNAAAMVHVRVLFTCLSLSALFGGFFETQGL